MEPAESASKRGARIFVPREINRRETRSPIVPAVAKRLVDLGARLEVEIGLGEAIGVPDSEFEACGAKVITDRNASLGAADIVLRLNPPPESEVRLLREGCLHVSFLDPFNNHSIVKTLADHGTRSVGMEMIPRTTLAQKMDALSSQANLAGYVAVTLAAERLGKILPMMMTPAGTITPARVFVIGVGVAGLQAIATARRLGARVEAFDTRPVVEEQVKSLGAKFFKVDLGETGETTGGYAKALTAEQIEKQQKAMAKRCSESDVVITAAQVFGRKAPIIMTDDMVRGMPPGSIVVDCAVETGGNVEGVVPGEEVDVGGVTIVGHEHLARRAPVHASEMYASNLGNFIAHFWSQEEGTIVLDPEDEIAKGCLVTEGKQVVNELVRNIIEKK